MTPRDGYTCEWVECLHDTSLATLPTEQPGFPQLAAAPRHLTAGALRQTLLPPLGVTVTSEDP